MVYRSGTPLTSFVPSRRSSTRGAYFLDVLCAVWEHCAGHCIEHSALSGTNSSVKFIRLDARFDGISRGRSGVVTSPLYIFDSVHHKPTNIPADFSIFFEHRERLGGPSFRLGSGPPRFRLSRLNYDTSFRSFIRYPGTSVMPRVREAF